jgi:ribonuclease HI
MKLKESKFRFTQREAIDRLEAISEYIDRILRDNSQMLISSVARFEYIQAVCKGEEEKFGMTADEVVKPLQHIILSCDASIKKNPGGPSSVGFVVEWPAELPQKTPLMSSQQVKANTNNEAEYDAVYFGLITLMNLHHNPRCKVEVRSDSRLVIDQLNGDMKCNNERLERRRDLILELIGELPVPVTFVWRPRNSTAALQQANYLAQDLLGVPRH